MLKSFAAHNFRCFREFQVTLGRRQLLMGVNGTGKSAFFEALGLMRELVVREERAEDVFQPEAFYRWKQNPQVSFELHFDLKGCEYVHKLTLRKDAGTVVVEQESLEGPGFDFRVHSGKATVTTAEGRRELSLDPKRAALGGHAMMEALPAVTRVASQYNKILCLRIRPEAMSARIFSEELRPRADFGNFASWYLHISRVEGGQVKQSLMQRLRAVLDGFQDLELRPVFRDEQRLIAVFRRNGGQTQEFQFDELSDGQRVLIALYTFLQVGFGEESIVCLDEPENYLALAEIQPWLLESMDRTEEAGAQLIVASHHPEVLNQMAPDSALIFYRDAHGEVRAKRFEHADYTGLTPAELVARGWEVDRSDR